MGVSKGKGDLQDWFDDTVCPETRQAPRKIMARP
jgi:hypothetical protein